MPDTGTILPDTEVLKLLYVCASNQSITLVARTTSAKVRCPVCGMLSRRVHSGYVRTLADLCKCSRLTAALPRQAQACSRVRAWHRNMLVRSEDELRLVTDEEAPSCELSK